MGVAREELLRQRVFVKFQKVFEDVFMVSNFTGIDLEDIPHILKLN